MEQSAPTKAWSLGRGSASEVAASTKVKDGYSPGTDPPVVARWRNRRPAPISSSTDN